VRERASASGQRRHRVGSGVRRNLPAQPARGQGGRRARSRAVLAFLLLDVNRVVSIDRLTDGVWGEDPPASAAATLPSYVSRPRKEIGTELVVSSPNGYALKVDPESIDVHRFERPMPGRALLFEHHGFENTTVSSTF
jgi:hypothetical protein